MFNILIDNCILLDFCQEERPRHSLVMEFLKHQPFSKFFISATTAERLYYQLAKADIEKITTDSFISYFEIMEVNGKNIFMAQELCDKWSEYEDAVEISICKLQNVDIFITADKKLYNKMQKLNLPNLKVELIVE